MDKKCVIYNFSLAHCSYRVNYLQGLFYTLFSAYYTYIMTGTFLLGTCRAAGYNECCVSDGITPCFGDPEDCFCDSTCYLYNDCCRDIEDICPPSNCED